MRLSGFVACMWMMCVSLHAADLDTLYRRLEYALEHRSEYMQRKENRIDLLKRQLQEEHSPEKAFRLYDSIYQEYYIYKFDSAMVYVDRAEQLATGQGNAYYYNLFAVFRAYLLSTTGYFSEAAATLKRVDRSVFDRRLRKEYYQACQWAYNVWAEYSGDKVYAPRYRKEATLYADSLLSVLEPGTREYEYRQAENAKFADKWDVAEKHYFQALKGLPVDTRLYACVTCGLALNYAEKGDDESYEKYLILSAISDQLCPLKENLSLQELALHIYKTREADVDQANRYLNYAMEDALFYNNRLRLLEIARKFPQIVVAYQQQNKEKSQRLSLALVFVCILSVGLLFSLLYIYKQIRQLHARRKELLDVNNQLKELNRKLMDTNHIREDYVSLFLDLCAAYIDKLNKYQELVKRKVKAKQMDDLLKLAYSSKMSEMDAKEFFVNFDTAFLAIYPNFIEEFNALLREGEQIVPKKGEILNTELRIFALIRMGIKDSSKIATLLFYSPQTIYNYRSAVKNRALVRDDFERQVEKLCSVI